jgi:hypothetical protein
VGPSLVLRLGARLLVLVPSSRRKHYKLDIIFYFIVLLVNALIFIVIGILREDPLSTGILDVFFLKISHHVSLLLRELSILKICQIFNSFYSILSVEICSSIPLFEMYCLLDNPPHKTKKVDSCGTSVENDGIICILTA